MFVLELSKPAGICLAAFREGGIVGYMVCSRYDTVWHVMNIAVEPALTRQGIASAMLVRLFELADEPNEQYTLEVRTSTTERSGSTSSSGSAPRAAAGPTTTTTVRTR